MFTRLKPLIICTFVVFYCITCKATETVRLSKKLQWSDLSPATTASGYSADFVDSYRDKSSGDLPLFVHRQALKDFASITSTEIENIESTSLNEAFIRPEDRQIPGNDWTIKTRITDGGGEPYLIITLLPVRRAMSLGYERLLSFDITLELLSAPKANVRSLNFAEESVLKEGNWFKFSTARDGVYRIDKSLLTQLGIDIRTLDLSAINIYGNGGELLPEENDVYRPDDLKKCAIYIEGDADGVFNDNDYILFYAKGPDTWKAGYESSAQRKLWRQTKNYYSDSAYYFLRTDDIDPIRIQNVNPPDLPETHTVTSFQDYTYIENDVFNLAKSGREYFGDEFYLNTTGNYSLQMPNMLSDFPALFEIKLAVRSIGGPSYFSVTAGGNTLQSNPVTSYEGALATVAGSSILRSNFNPSGSTVPVSVVFNKYSNTADVRGYIDYMRLNATRALSLSGSQMKFRDTTNVGPGMLGKFQISGVNSQLRVWDITDINNPARIMAAVTNSVGEWKMNTDIVHEYIAFSNSGFQTPVALGRVSNQNLHALEDIDLVIVSAPPFLDAANEVAQIHAAEGMSVAITTVFEIFNEFSSGSPDVTAIRMFMKMLYDRANGDESKTPQNLLMFGDGEYNNNRGLRSFLGSNVMIFESEESLSPADSYVSDDYFVMVSDDDDGSSLNFPDIGVGRIPATDLSEANAYVGKIKAYIASNTSQDGGASCINDQVQSPYGPWRNILTFIADDQDGSGLPVETVHLEDADELSATMKARHPEYDIVKIYLDAYKQLSTPGGERYPDAEIAIKNRVQNGSLIVTYLGHGGERGWAHERILDINTITSWTNKFKLPVFLTATCELARYDDPSFNTAGELLVMNPDGGAIAMLTTTRVVFAGSNMEMDRAFFNVALEEQTIDRLTLGKINLLTKNGVSSSNSSRPNFSLLGDPALKIVYPKFNVYTTQINDIPIENFSDTLKALEEIEFTGYVGDAEGNVLNNFNGFIYPTVFDKLTHVYTQNNDFDGQYGEVQEYDVFNKNIFKGKASVRNGEFSFKFIVPYDINYTSDSGRVSYYAVGGNIDAHGFSQDFLIGSSLDGAQLNTVGPEIELFLNDTTFVSGGLSDTKPIFLAHLRDENGINTVGNGIGHDLTAILDRDSQNPIVLNEYYETNLDTYKSGIVRYQMPELGVGDHSISLKAWDVHNNSSTASLAFTVAESGDIALQHVLNYPNPFTTHTEFMFEHNQVCTTLQVQVQVFTVSGKLVKTLQQEVMQNGFRSTPIAWDGTDDFGDRIGRGVYVYKIEVQNETGQKAEQYEKLVILK